VELRKIRKNRRLLGISHRTARRDAASQCAADSFPEPLQSDCAAVRFVQGNGVLVSGGDRCVRLTVIQMFKRQNGGESPMGVAENFEDDGMYRHHTFHIPKV